MQPSEAQTLALRQFRPLPLIRNSERASFKTCQAQWNWRWNYGLERVNPRQDARWFGTGWHYVWAEHYTPPQGKTGFIRNSKDPHETWDEWTKNAFTSISCGPWFDEVAESKFIDAKALGHSMIDGQLKEYNSDPAWEVLMPEQRFRAGIPFNSRQQTMPLSHWFKMGYNNGAKGNIAEIVGTFDMPIRDHSGSKPHVKIVDWKTTNKKENAAYLTKDDQAGTYIAVSTGFLRTAGFIDKTEEVVGMIFSYARKGKSDGRPKNELGQSLNKDGSVSKMQPAPLFWRDEVLRNKHNRLRQISRIADDVEAIQSVRTGNLPVLKSPGQHCGWCDFNDLCDVDEDGGDTEQFMKDMFKVSDPYADHQEGALNSKASVRST